MRLAGALSAVAGVFVERVPVEQRPKLQLVAERPAPTWSVVALGQVDDAAERIARQLAEHSGSTAVVTTIDAAEGTVALVADADSDPAYRDLVADELRAQGRKVVVATVGDQASRLGSRDREAKAVARRLVAASLRSEKGQATIALLAGVFLTFIGVALFAQYGGALAARGSDQRVTDVAAAASAKRMAGDYPRLFVPPTLPNGAPNPLHMTVAQYRSRAIAIARSELRRGGAGIGGSVRLSGVPHPTTVTVRTSRRRKLDVLGDARSVIVKARSAASLTFEIGSMAPAMPGRASGGGYDGPLAYRQGKPMRPDVAAAFDRMHAAATRAGHSLTIASAFRSDAEQARLFAQRPDPKWVAPPGTSLHRYGTELDLGPPAAYSWLKANARRFGFIHRYAWEPWHYGFGANPRDVPAQYNKGSFEPPGGDSGKGELPSWVPARFRATIARAAQRHNVQPVLLAAQLKAESNFDSNAVSPVGAQGIAQFMPGTAKSMGLRDPFDPEQAIEAQAKLMGQLIRQFGKIPEALAAYNAGPGAVQQHGGIPPYTETKNYVAKILALVKGVAELDDPAFAGILLKPKVVLVD